MKLRNLVLCLFSVCAMPLLAMNGVDQAKVAEFKAVVATKDCQQIRNAVVQSWPISRVGLTMLWFGNTLTFGAISLSPTERVYGTCLREFLVKHILHPVMYGNADIKQVIEQIDILAGEKSSKKQGIFGIKKAASEVSHALKIAICKARHVNPADYQLVENGNEEAREIIAYVGRVTGEAPIMKARLFPLSSYKTVGLEIIASAVVGGIYYYCFAKSDESEYQESEAELDSSNNDAQVA